MALGRPGLPGGPAGGGEPVAEGGRRGRGRRAGGPAQAPSSLEEAGTRAEGCSLVEAGFVLAFDGPSSTLCWQTFTDTFDGLL